MNIAQSAIRSVSVLALGIGLMNTSAALAQEFGDDEVIVTATKRQTTLQEAPVAVTVTSGETIEKAKIVTINDLQSVVPSLRVQTRQNASATNFFIRGFGNGANQIGIEPSVGVFIDGVYRSRSGSAISDLQNIERIEVLRGPQSTLFGKNASAGVISVVTKKPQIGEMSGKGEVTYGNYNQIGAKAYVNIPISDNAAASLAGSINKRDGLYTNTTDGGELNNINRWAIYGDVLFEPSDATEVRVKFDYDQIDEDCCAAASLQQGLGTVILGILPGDTGVSADPFDFEVASDLIPFQEIANYGGSLQINHDFGDFGLTAISAYRKNDTLSGVDTDFSGVPVFALSPRDYEIDTITQEIRLTSQTDSRLDWMIGGFYFNESISEESQVLFGPAGRGYLDTFAAFALGGLGITANSFSDIEAGLGLPAGSFFAPGTGSLEFFEQDNESFSVFGQVDLHVTDKLTATLGVNYTDDTKTVELGSRGDTDPFSAVPITDLASLGAPLQFLAGFQFLPRLVSLPNSGEPNTSSDDDVSITAKLGYDLHDRVNVYATYSTGFKATSWNLSRDTRPGNRFARPEDTTLYELGIKAKLSDRFNVNAAVFDQTIKDFQTNIFSGTGFVFQNAEQQSVSGAEVEVTWEPIDNFTLVGAATLLDPVYDSFPNASGAGGTVVDRTGQAPAGVAEENLSLSANYDFSLGNGMNAYIRGDYQYESDVLVEENTGAISRDVNTINASMGLDFGNGIAAQLWGRNLSDDQYVRGAFPPAIQPGDIRGYISTPRTYGITISGSFN